jgi:uncharacterized membrane protein YqaE (UPF0057 family)
MLAIVGILCPPLAVLLTSPPSHAIKNVGLTLLFYVPGVLHARAAVEQYTVKRRYATLMQLLDDRAITDPTERTRRAARPYAA